MDNTNNGIRCPQCGEWSIATARFCSGCGARMQEADPLANTLPDIPTPTDHSYTAADVDGAVTSVTDETETLDSIPEDTEAVADNEAETETSVYEESSEAEADTQMTDAAQIPIETVSDEVDTKISDLENPQTDVLTDVSEKKASDPEPTVSAFIPEEKEAPTPSPVRTSSQTAVKSPVYRAQTASYKHPLFGSANIHIALILLMSIVLAVLFFTPIVKTKTALNEKVEYSVEFTPYEFVQLGAKSFETHTTAQLEKTRAYKAFLTRKEKALSLSTESRLSASEESFLEKFAKESLEVNISRAGTTVKLNQSIAFILSALYAVTVAIAILLSLAALLFHLIDMNEAFLRMISYAERTVVALLAASPAYLVVLMQTANFHFGFDVPNFGDRGVSFAAGGIILLVMAALALIYAFVKFISSMIGKETSALESGSKMKIAASILLVIALVCMFLPCISVGFAAPGKRSVQTETHYIYPQSMYEFASNDVTYLNDIANNVPEEFFVEWVYSGVKEHEGFGNAAMDALNWVSFHYVDGMPVVFGFIAGFHVFAVLALSLAIVILLAFVIRKRAVKRPKALLFFINVLTTGYLLMNLTLIIINNVSMSSSVRSRVIFNVGIAPIAAVVCTVIASILFAIPARRNSAVSEYDDPDVSYAPYVVQ